LIGGSILLLALAALFGALNLSKVKTLRVIAAEAITARKSVEQSHVKKENELKAREAAIAAAQAKLAERDGNAVASEEQLAQILNEKKQLEAKLQDKDSEIAAVAKADRRKTTDIGQPGRAIHH
jgi:septal ring factor EnvC (AmiA/AmiB activator)